ncbi:hypothetical protein [Acuticoccus sediminis]|uniref:hypothetical protein n=1 Tax=Acuticoccus sediminis TaxID=2184697 RepID=UPI001CFE9896|nr:hypothetical protein [Acuticoccus sediminis]
MTRSAPGSILFGAGLALSFATMAAAGDIRTLTVGEPVTTLSHHGYGDLACLGPDGAPVAHVSEWSAVLECPADAAGLRTVRVYYDDAAQEWISVNDKWGGTRVAGHPVELTVRVDADGVLETLAVRTDPEARQYMHKKAFLLGNKVKSHYGWQGWQCSVGQPSAERREVGGTFVDERCEKVTDGREIVLQTQLYRDAADDVVNATSFEVKRRPQS